MTGYYLRYSKVLQKCLCIKTKTELELQSSSTFAGNQPVWQKVYVGKLWLTCFVSGDQVANPKC